MEQLGRLEIEGYEKTRANQGDKYISKSTITKH